MKSRLLLLAALVLGGATSVRAVDFTEIPSPRPDGWVVDMTGRVPRKTIESLNKLADEVNEHENAELAVVVVGTIDGRNPRKYATSLFNHWEIGDAKKKNGILVFAALDDRKSEIILGDGVDDAAQIRTSQSIMDGEIVPRFKKGDIGGALLAGAHGCATRILKISIKGVKAPARLMGGGGGGGGARNRNRGQNGMFWTWMALGVGGGGTTIGVFSYMRYLRYRPRQCTGCGEQMTRLGEREDDAHLKKGQRTEERIGSVDYDVWNCGRCGDTQVLHYNSFFTRF